VHYEAFRRRQGNGARDPLWRADGDGQRAPAVVDVFPSYYGSTNERVRCGRKNSRAEELKHELDALFLEQEREHEQRQDFDSRNLFAGDDQRGLGAPMTGGCAKTTWPKSIPTLDSRASPKQPFNNNDSYRAHGQRERG
jgi:hypothetical protein